MTLTARDRFVRLMRFEPVDRPPLLALEPFETVSRERWRGEGLPPDTAIEDAFGMDRLRHVPVRFGPWPPFPAGRLAEDAESYVEYGAMGATVRREKRAPSLYYGHVDHPVKCRADWDLYRRRFDPESPGRRPSDAELAALNAAPDPVGLCLFPFFFRLGFYSMGMERFLTAFHDEPDLIHDMFAFWSRFVIELIAPLLPKLRLDYAAFNEDLAFKTGPLVSPAVYREFWLPHQDPVVQLLQRHGVPVICQWSAGRLTALLPILLDHGFTCTWPLERAAGMDAPALRAAFGRRLLLGGNIAKEALLDGPAAVAAELRRLEPLLRAGGFVPALDDMVPAETPLAAYRDLIAQLRDWRIGT